MPTFLTPIVGTHFHPPAKLLLTKLPIGTPLILSPTPDNPYDSNAIEILLASSNKIAWTESEKDDLLGYGISPEDLEEPDHLWMLGFIPASTNTKALSNPSYLSNIQVLEILATSPNHTSSLTFAPDGSPLVSLSTGAPPVSEGSKP